MLQFCFICLEFNLYLFIAFVTVSPKAREHCHMGPELCYKAHFALNKVSLLTNCVILNKSLTLCFDIYKMGIRIGVHVSSHIFSTAPRT